MNDPGFFNALVKDVDGALATRKILLSPSDLRKLKTSLRRGRQAGLNLRSLGELVHRERAGMSRGARAHFRPWDVDWSLKWIDIRWKRGTPGSR